MPVVTRSIPVTPYNGGALQLNRGYSNGCVLTSERMVFHYCQTNPNWRFFSIIDTPGGWASTSGTPAVTANQMFDINVGTGGTVMMQRLNDTTFVMWTASGNNVGTLEVFEVNDNVVTKVHSAIQNIDNGFLWSRTVTPTRFIPLSENKVALISTMSTGVYSRTLTWNPVAKTMTVGTSGVILTINASSQIDTYSYKIPGSTKHVVACNYGGNGNFTNNNTDGSILNADGTVAINRIRTFGNSNYPCVMAEDRIAHTTSWSSVQYYNVVDANTTQTSQGGGQFASTTNSNAYITIPITRDYYMMWDRSLWAALSANFRVKVIRREDSNISAQSTASATSSAGFTITCPYIDTFSDKQRPEMTASGDIMWMGFNSTNTQFAWNVVKNPS